MDAQRLATQQHHSGSFNTKQRPVGVEPGYPFPSALPPEDSERSPPTNGMARTTSRRRRASGSGPLVAAPDEYTPQPPAPEVPKAPPVSYRPPYHAEAYASPKTDYPSPSFAERARALTGNTIPTQSPNSDIDVDSRRVKPIRRGSLNRPIGGVYSEIQQHKRDSYPYPTDPVSPWRLSNPSSPQQHQSPNTYQSSRAFASPQSQQLSTTEPRRFTTSARRASTGLAQSSKKEWAPDRSPLQKLEVKLSDISKEEKRARVQAAEQRLKESQGGDKSRQSGREGGPGLDRSSSRRVSAMTGGSQSKAARPLPTRIPLDIDPVPKSDEGGNTLPVQLQTKAVRDAPQYHKRRDSVTVDSYQHVAQARGMPGHTQLTDREAPQKGIANSPRTPQQEQIRERGVRFQGQDGVEDDESYFPNPDKLEPHNHRRSPGIAALAKSDEARGVQRDRSHRNNPNTANRSSSKAIPIQQQNMYKSRVETSHIDASAANFGGATDPVPRHAVQGRGQASNYEIPPQTAAGIQARQALGFGNEPTGDVELSTQRKHRLPEILHRNHNHTSDTHVLKPRQLDEWRRAGTARLSAADFVPETEPEPEKGQNAWWEDGRSGRRRKAAPSNAIEAQALQGDYQSKTGKSRSHFKYEVHQDRQPREFRSTTRSTRTRQYMGEDEYQRLYEESYKPLESHLTQFLHRSGHDQTRGLSSAYSYSCPDLASHDPSHESHLCQPYMSKELTQSMRSIRIRPAPELSTFQPPLYLKCGPLLRYTGLRRDRHVMKARSGGSSSIARETWRGSVMIVTADADSIYEPAPILRLFPEPMDVLPPLQNGDSGNPQDPSTEYVDPVAGLPKLSRSGNTVYVKPVDDLEHAKDLSRLENDDGLFEETRTAAVPTAYGTPDFRASSSNPKPVRHGTRATQKGHQVEGIRLHVERGVTFWRFNLEVELGVEQTRIAYSINKSPSVGFWVPARGHSMNAMFHSCNGFSLSVNPDHFAGPDPMWRDVLNSHQTRPFHVMIGGGDQIYNDAVMEQCPLFRDWVDIKNPHHKHEADFSPSLREELETFYLERYSMWFSQGLFGMANSQIPMVNMWDDHDIIDGFGSYPHHVMSTPVFCGIGAVAFKYYMLFQHQSLPDETSAEEPSWLMGAAQGPYINELSRSVFVSLGKNIALVALDCRTERMREQVLSEASYELIFDRCRREILEGETKHLIVLLGIPIAYPRLVWLENLLTSKVMDPVKSLGRAGVFGGFLNKFDGGVEILDDLNDHWTAKNHKVERNWFVQELQELAAEKSIRVTILGGDVHLAAVGQFYSNPKLGIPKDKDHRYMANIVSSAIVNTPPSNNVADILNKRNKTHHLDLDTDEDMIPMFTHDVNGTSRNNKRLLPRRNWCSIREYHPGSTPPPTPPSSGPEIESDGSPPPPTRLQRTLSLTRSDVRPGNLLRRLSGRGPPPTNGYANGDEYDLNDPPSPNSPENDGYFPRQPTLPKRASTVSGNHAQRYSSAPLPNSSAPLPRPGNFHRRPTNLSEKAAAKGDLDNTTGHINLEHGLDIVLNCEVNQKDPAGTTIPYRLLIPALFYEGYGDENAAPFRKASLISRLTSIRGKRRNTLGSTQEQDHYGQAGSVTRSHSESEEEFAQPRPRRWSFGITQRRQYRDQTPPLEREIGEELEIGEEGTQKGRQFEHRRQQIGQSQQQPFSMPPRQKRQYGELGAHTPTDAYNPERGDSVDYHQHVDSSPPVNGGYPGRRPSKVDRILGAANLQRNPSAGGGIGKIQRSSSVGVSAPQSSVIMKKSAVTDRHSFETERDDYEDEPFEPVGSNRISQGYSGIEAYSEKKGWRKWLDKARDIEEKSSGRR